MKIIISFLLVIGTIECWSQSFSKEFLARHSLDTLFVKQIPKGRSFESTVYFVKTLFKDSLDRTEIRMVPKIHLMDFIKSKFNLPEDSLDIFIQQSILLKKVYPIEDTAYLGVSSNSDKVNLRKLKKLNKKKLRIVLSKYFDDGGYIRHGFEAKQAELSCYLFDHYIIFEIDIAAPHISNYYRAVLGKNH